MNPYKVLGVAPNATDDEVRNAYRNLVKQFHPDVNKNEDANNRVAQINAAYEVLSDPERRARYDHPEAMVVEEDYEDPIEAHKREFQRKRWEMEQKAREKRLDRDRRIYAAMRIVSFPILAFAFLVVLDDFLPRNVYKEKPIAGWQRRTTGYKYSQGTLFSYLQTRNFYIRCPITFISTIRTIVMSNLRSPYPLHPSLTFPERLPIRLMEYNSRIQSEETSTPLASRYNGCCSSAADLFSGEENIPCLTMD